MQFESKLNILTVSEIEPASLETIEYHLSILVHGQLHFRTCAFYRADATMQRGLPTRKLSVRLSVRLANACIATKRKKNLSSLLYHTKDYLA